ncbi:MAG: sugar phosphate nucleotidyltransferase [Nitrospiraceae bacterium]
MKAILLAGWHSRHCFPIQHSMPCLPFLNRPLITYQLDVLCRNGISEVAIAIAAQEVDSVKAILASEESSSDLRIHYVVDTVPRGPAGCIKQCEEFVGKESFCVVNGNLYLNSIDLKGFLRSHLAVGGIATLGVLGREVPEPKPLENVLSNEEGLIRGFEILHPLVIAENSTGLRGFTPFGLKFSNTLRREVTSISRNNCCRLSPAKAWRSISGRSAAFIPRSMD